MLYFWPRGGRCGRMFLDVSRDRLFVVTVVFTMVMTVLFAGALVYDFMNNRGGGPVATRTVTTTQASADPNAAGSAGTAGSSGGSSSGSRSGGGGGGSGAASTQTIAAGAPITIGALVTQSGPLDASDAFRAQEAWVQMTNSQGGINGHKIVLVVKDDQEPGRRAAGLRADRPGGTRAGACRRVRPPDRRGHGRRDQPEPGTDRQRLPDVGAGVQQPVHLVHDRPAGYLAVNLRDVPMDAQGPAAHDQAICALRQLQCHPALLRWVRQELARPRWHAVQPPTTPTSRNR